MTTINTYKIDGDREMLISRDHGRKSASSSSSSTATLSSATDVSSFTFPSASDIENDTDDFIFLGMRTPPHAPTPNNSPTTPEIPVASLIHLSDDETIVTDSCYSRSTLPQTTVTWAPMGGDLSCTQAHLPNYYKCQKVGGVVESARKLSAKVEECGGFGVTAALVPESRACSSSVAVPALSVVASATPSSSSSTLIAVSAEASPKTHLHICSSPSVKRERINEAIETPVRPIHPPTVPARSHRQTTPTVFEMCKENNDTLGGVCVPTNSHTLVPDTAGTCPQTCSKKITQLSKELSETKDQLFALSVQMEEQASLNARLMEENRKYIAENEKLKARSRAGNSFNHQDNYDCYNHHHQVYPDHDNITDLEDRIMALQLQNSELNLCLEREKRKRKEAEARVDKDRGYIKRLEDSVQTLRGTRVVMDPSSYRQVAEAYIAARRTPARRPHTHSGIPGSDLVCDSPNDKVMDNQQMSHLPLHQTSSCPSSPNTCPSPNSRRVYPKLDSLEYQMYPGEIPMGRKTKKDRNQTPQDLSRGLGGLSVGGNPMNPWDYQQLLKNLEDIDGSSRGALS